VLVIVIRDHVTKARGRSCFDDPFLIVFAAVILWKRYCLSSAIDTFYAVFSY